MTNPRLTIFYRDIPGGNGINDATGLVKRHIDNGNVATGTTAGAGASAGKVSWNRPDIGYPGPVYVELSGNGQRKVDSGMALHQVGAYWLDDVPNALQALGLGVISGLTVTPVVGTMQLSVAAGYGVFKDGLPFVLDTATVAATVSAAHPTSPRIDRLVLRVIRRGQGEEGRFSFVLIPGTAAASPLPPNIVQDATTWDYSLAQIRVDAAVTSIASNKVTSEMYAPALGQSPIQVWPAGLVKGDLFQVNASGVVSRLGLGSDNQHLSVDPVSGLAAWRSMTSRDRRGYFSAVDGNAASITTDTTNTVASVLALQTTISVPAGTWTITVNAGLSLHRDALGQSYAAIEVESDEAGGYTLQIDTPWTYVGLARTVSGLPGNQDINIRVRYRSVTSGRTYARNPTQRIELERTA
jgi:hypothetical protein